MFQEIDENFYVLLNNVAGVKLVKENDKYIWLFYTNHPEPLKSKAFDSEEDAKIWFKNIKYNYYRTKE
ncbi:MAG: hypothetical protein ACPLXN_04350 [Sulfurihydrogenibium sp.]|uniref:hypothetical protein n=1 Tax=Sulfurihydrogenibium sp. TaxID=2053621 RepID=UPI003C7A6F61